jgi:hypothetical protein
MKDARYEHVIRLSRVALVSPEPLAPLDPSGLSVDPPRGASHPSKSSTEGDLTGPAAASCSNRKR